MTPKNINIDFFAMICENYEYVLNTGTNKWEKNNMFKGNRGNQQRCYKDVKTLRAAKGYIKRHNEIPKGTKFKVFSFRAIDDRIIIKK